MQRVFSVLISTFMISMFTLMSAVNADSESISGMGLMSSEQYPVRSWMGDEGALISNSAIATSYFEDLRNHFNQASLPLESDLFGWRSGRCYDFTEPSKPFAALLIGGTGKNDEKHGPLFPPDFKLMILEWRDATPDQWDHPDDSERAEIKRVIDEGWDRFTNAHIVDGALASDIDYGNSQTQIRKKENYYFAKHLMLDPSDGGKAVLTLAFCYFFKDVTR